MEPGAGAAGLAPPPADPLLSTVRLRRGASNLGVALLFFAALQPGAVSYGSGIADTIWLIGAALMGLLSLVRVPPSSSTVTASSIVSTAAMMLLPTIMIRPAEPSVGLLRDIAIAVELAGVVFSQGSRLYMGRRFGLLPANRGIVSTGPFRLIRHPVYAGWIVLLIGHAMAFPSVLNFAAIPAMLPFMIWRIALEEQLLAHDPEYRACCERTPYRLVPGVF